MRWTWPERPVENTQNSFYRYLLRYDVSRRCTRANESERELRPWCDPYRMTFDTRVYVYSLCFLDTHAIQCTLRSERFGFIFFFYALGLSAIFLTFTISVCTGEVSIYNERRWLLIFFPSSFARARPFDVFIVRRGNDETARDYDEDDADDVSIKKKNISEAQKKKEITIATCTLRHAFTRNVYELVGRKRSTCIMCRLDSSFVFKNDCPCSGGIGIIFFVH
jgi:hypothetical protein